MLIKVTSLCCGSTVETLNAENIMRMMVHSGANEKLRLPIFDTWLPRGDALTNCVKAKSHEAL